MEARIRDLEATLRNASLIDERSGGDAAKVGEKPASPARSPVRPAVVAKKDTHSAARTADDEYNARLWSEQERYAK